MKIGIDKIGFAAPSYVLDLADLALARQVDPNKYKLGLLQSQMAVAPVTQDIVTLGAQTAQAILTDEDKAQIDMIIVGTESSIDQSKASCSLYSWASGHQPLCPLHRNQGSLLRGHSWSGISQEPHRPVSKLQGLGHRQ